jgi:hypothetical protein
MKHNNISLTFCLLLASSSASAHVGHDHDHWSSEPIHMLFYGVIALTALAATIWTVKAKRKKNTKEYQQ